MKKCFKILKGLAVNKVKTIAVCTKVGHLMSGNGIRTGRTKVILKEFFFLLFLLTSFYIITRWFEIGGLMFKKKFYMVTYI